MKKLYFALDRFCGKRWFPLIFIPLATCFLLLYSYTTSPLFLNDGMDSAVFKTMGLAILKGKIPYVDIFDHKGPVLYFIDALGQWMIPGRMGIFLLQVIGLSVALFYMFKTARLFVGNALSFLVILFTLFIFGGIIQEGNQCEEWMMYFFTVALYYALKYFVNDSGSPHPMKYSLFYGFCFGMSFFIRPNDAVAMMGGLMTGVTIWSVYNKEYKNALLNALCFGAGFLLVAVPIVCYFAWNNALGDLWYGLIGFNNTYSGGIISMLLSLLGRRKESLLLLFVILGVMAYDTRYKDVLFIVVPMMVLGIVLLGISYYRHYYIVFIPIFVIYFVLLLLQSKSIMAIAIVVFCFSLQADVLNSFVNLALKDMRWKIEMLRSEKDFIGSFYEESDKLLSHIPENEKDEVWNYNLGWEDRKSSFSVLYHFGIVQCNLITCGADDKLLNIDDVAKKMPLWVVMERKENDNIVLPSRYDLVAKTDTTICKIELYRRK